MLQGINRIGRSIVGRVIIALLFGILIVSFAIWGIGDIFRGSVRTQVARVGEVDVTGEAFRTAYQTEFQNLARRTRQPITPELARAIGLEGRVLSRLVSEAAIDQKVRELGLSVPDALVVQSIQNDPTFRGPNGQFNRATFTELLRSNGIAEGQFVREQRTILARQQLVEALTGDLAVPLAMREAVHRYGAERRGVEFVVLAPTSVGELSTPDDAGLQSFFDQRRATYRAPEYRAINVLVLDAGTLAKPDAVSDDEARRAYERAKDSRFGSPEKRTIQQIVFPSRDAAAAAEEKLKAGTPFEEVAKERGIDESTLTLGTFARGEVLDPATADAAFTLAAGGVTPVLDGRFGPVIVRVTRVEPGTLKPFDEVKDELKRDLAREAARSRIEQVHDAIEDQRASAKPLGEVAKERGLELTRMPAIDRTGTGKDGQPIVGLPDQASLLQAAFRADIGADTEALRLPGGGYAWFEVTGIEPARDRTLAEVRERVAADWRSDETARLLSEKARTIMDRLGKGEALEAVAKELGTEVVSVSDLARAQPAPNLPANAVARIFATPVGQAADAESQAGARVVFRVASATVPPFVTTTQDAAATEERLRSALADDLLSEYIADAQAKLGVRTYPENIRRAIGGES
ncbi:MAG: SurA N-terminal domain-containing protein [Methylobacteriaceae bacterium]|nr:SurA N-terminal domain-containing protein [Methylobacteriaceae bacterium]